MTTGAAELDRMIRSIRGLKGLAERAAPDVAEAIHAELVRTIAAGTTPDGDPWRPTQDGRTPLRNAAAAIRCAAVGTRIYVRLIGPEARHHRGSARGGIVRRVLPASSRIPPAMASVITDVLTRHFHEAVRGD
jgi:hypothetical protein